MKVVRKGRCDACAQASVDVVQVGFGLASVGICAECMRSAYSMLTQPSQKPADKVPVPQAGQVQSVSAMSGTATQKGKV